MLAYFEARLGSDWCDISPPLQKQAFLTFTPLVFYIYTEGNGATIKALVATG
jgi:hypothetical protein